MPKNKTHSGAKKRFRVTGSGRLMREQANAMDQPVDRANLKSVKSLLGR